MKQYDKKIIYGSISIIIIICIIYFLLPIITENEVQINNGENQDSYSSSMNANSSNDGEYHIYITGAIENPGLYNLEKSYTIHEAITLAGGLLPYAGTDSINLAEKVEPGTHIHIPFNFNGNPEALLRKKKININTATIEELKSLPGIGETMAKRIDEYRKEHGSFASVNDMTKVKGIGKALLRKIQDKVTV